MLYAICLYVLLIRRQFKTKTLKPNKNETAIAVSNKTKTKHPTLPKNETSTATRQKTTKIAYFFLFILQKHPYMQLP